MKHYVHDIPGRLRVRNSILKNPAAHETVRKLLSALVGIQRAEFGLVTGSLTVFYHEKVISSENILETLERAGYFDSTRIITNDEYVQQMVLRAVAFIGRLVSTIL